MCTLTERAGAQELGHGEHRAEEGERGLGRGQQAAWAWTTGDVIQGHHPLHWDSHPVWPEPLSCHCLQPRGLWWVSPQHQKPLSTFLQGRWRGGATHGFWGNLWVPEGELPKRGADF